MTAKAFRCPSCGYLALESEGCRYCHPNKEANDQETQETRELKTGAVGRDAAAPQQLTLL